MSLLTVLATEACKSDAEHYSSAIVAVASVAMVCFVMWLMLR